MGRETCGEPADWTSVLWKGVFQRRGTKSSEELIQRERREINGAGIESAASLLVSSFLTSFRDEKYKQTLCCNSCVFVVMRLSVDGYFFLQLFTIKVFFGLF